MSSRKLIAPRRFPAIPAGLASLALAAMVVPAALDAAPLKYVDTVMTGLANPRGLAVGPDGGIYVAEAGSGGNGPGIISGGSPDPLLYGTTGAITRLLAGVQEKYVTDLPSFAGTSGAEAHGAQHLAFGADGKLYVTLGLGANPAELAKIAGQPNAELAGKLAVIDGGVASAFADIPAFEAANNPDGGGPDNAGPDSNAYGLVALPTGGFLVTDAGANAVFSVSSTGAIATQAVLPAQPNPLPFGPPFYQAVPTGAALAPDGSLVFGQLTGFPFVGGAAQLYRLDGGVLTTIPVNLTNIIDVAFGADGTLYVLEMDSDRYVLGPDNKGAIYSVAMDGTTTLLYDNLITPTGFAIKGRTFYVSVDGFSPTGGAVVALAPVPLPFALPAFAAGLGLLVALRRRGRAQS